MQAKQVARALGWFSIGLGLTEVAIPQRLSRFLGLNDRTELVRVFGLREIGAGLGILRQPQQARWVWARVGGDVLDLLVLGSALGPSNTKRNRAGVAFGSVAAITVIDVICARNLSRENNDPSSELSGNALDVERTLTIGKSADELYQMWREPQTLPQVMEPVADVVATNADQAHWELKGPGERTFAFDTSVVEDRPGELVRWETQAGGDVSHTGTIRFRPAPGNRGTETTLRVQLALPGGVLGGAAAMLGDVVPKTLAYNALRRFKSLVESGEMPTLAHNPSARPGDGDTL